MEGSVSQLLISCTVLDYLANNVWTQIDMVCTVLYYRWMPCGEVTAAANGSQHIARLYSINPEPLLCKQGHWHICRAHLYTPLLPEWTAFLTCVGPPNTRHMVASGHDPLLLQSIREERELHQVFGEENASQYSNYRFLCVEQVVCVVCVWYWGSWNIDVFYWSQKWSTIRQQRSSCVSCSQILNHLMWWSDPPCTQSHSSWGGTGTVLDDNRVPSEQKTGWNASPWQHSFLPPLHLRESLSQQSQNQLTDCVTVSL